MIDTTIGNFRIDELLGEGGMGVVYRGTDLSLDRTVAIKVLNSDLSRSPELVQRFRSEARAQANLNHVNLATLYTFLVHEGRAMMVMEFIQGETIDHMINRRGPIPSQEAIPIFKQALLGLGYAHRSGVIHRDIKPSNIMLNTQGIVKVMDFGIAKVMGNRGMTRTGTQLGTPYYMPPEVVMNNPVDIRSDVYSLGVTLYEMLSAHVPFPGETDYQILSAHVNTPPPPPTRYYPYIPSGIQNAVLKALEKNPDHRFQSVEEFGAALERSEDFSYAPQGLSVATSAATAAPSTLAPPPPLAAPYSPPPLPGPVGAGQTQHVTQTIPPLAATQSIYIPPPGPHAAAAKQPFWTRPRMVVAGVCTLLVLVLLGWLIPEPGRQRVGSGDEPAAQTKADPNKSAAPTGTIEIPMGGEPASAAPASAGTAPASGSSAPASSASDLKVAFRAASPSIKLGQTAHLVWSVQGAKEVTITPGIGTVKAEGSMDIPLRRTTEFKLVAKGADGHAITNSAVVNVEEAQTPAPVRLTAEFDAQNGRIPSGQSAVLRWSVPGATEVSISPGVGTVPAQGSVRVSPAQTTQYFLTARGPGGSVASSTTTITVDPPVVAAVRIAFDAVPNIIQQGQYTTLRWSLANARTATIEPEPGVLHQVNGQQRVAPAATTTYRLTAHAADGTATTASFTVQVEPRTVTPPPAPSAAVGHVFNVVHDHQGALGNTAVWLSCWGQIQVSGGRLRYVVTGSTDNRRDNFDIALSDIQEAKLNRMPIRARPSFHIRVGGQTLNFVPANATTSQIVGEIEQGRR